MFASLPQCSQVFADPNELTPAICIQRWWRRTQKTRVRNRQAAPPPHLAHPLVVDNVLASSHSPGNGDSVVPGTMLHERSDARSEAAGTIQAGYRGMQGRRQSKMVRDAKAAASTRMSDISVGKEINKEELDQKHCTEIKALASQTPIAAAVLAEAVRDPSTLAAALASASAGHDVVSAASSVREQLASTPRTSSLSAGSAPLVRQLSAHVIEADALHQHFVAKVPMFPKLLRVLLKTLPLYIIESECPTMQFWIYQPKRTHDIPISCISGFAT